MVFGGDEPAFATGTCTNDDKNSSRRQTMDDVDTCIAVAAIRVCDSRMSIHVRISLGLALCRRLDLDGLRLEGTAQHVVPSPRENFAMLKRRN